MPHVSLKGDSLDETNRRFVQGPLRQPLFINSVPKSGTHLLRNIVRMFVPLEQQYQSQFIQLPNLQQHLAAFDLRRCYVSWGHMLFSDASAIELAGTRHVLLVRDPYTWVVSRARFFLSEEFSGNVEHLRSGTLSVASLFNLMIFGVYQRAPSLAEIYTHNAVAWLGTGVHLVRFEELAEHAAALETVEAELYFGALFAACGIHPVPEDWRERVRAGADRKQSGTARENLRVSIDLPDQLAPAQKRVVDHVAPGLRQLLGYR